MISVLAIRVLVTLTFVTGRVLATSLGITLVVSRGLVVVRWVALVVGMSVAATAVTHQPLAIVFVILAEIVKTIIVV